MAWKNVGDDATEAAAQQEIEQKRAAARVTAKDAGTVIVETSGRFNLKTKANEYRIVRTSGSSLLTVGRDSFWYPDRNHCSGATDDESFLNRFTFDVNTTVGLSDLGPNT